MKMMFRGLLVFALFIGVSVFAEGNLSRVAVVNGAGDGDKNGAFCDLLFVELVKNPSLELVDREMVDKILREQSISGSSSSGSFIKAGKVLRADLLIVLLKDGEKAKLCFFDVNHGLRVAVCNIDLADKEKSLDAAKVSLKKAQVFAGGKGKAIYSVPPFFNNDILFQNDKYQGLLAGLLRDELISKGTLLIEFDEALRIFGELGLSQGGDRIKALPLTLISGEFTQDSKDKNILVLKLSKIQLNESTASICNGNVNIKTRKLAGNDIAKLANEILKGENKAVSFDLEKQSGILTERADKHFKQSAPEQAKLEASVALVMEPSSEKARSIICDALTKIIEKTSPKKLSQEAFYSMYMELLEQLEWFASNGKKFDESVNLSAMTDNKLSYPYQSAYMRDYNKVAEIGLKSNPCSLYCRMFACSLSKMDLSDEQRLNELLRVVHQYKVYKFAGGMGEECFHFTVTDKNKFFRRYLLALLNEKEIQGQIRSGLEWNLKMLNNEMNSQKKPEFSDIPKVEAPEGMFNKYLIEAKNINASEFDKTAKQVQRDMEQGRYNEARLGLESITKSGGELDKKQHEMLIKAYDGILMDLCLDKASQGLMRRIYLAYIGRYAAALEIAYNESIRYSSNRAAWGALKELLKDEKNKNEISQTIAKIRETSESILRKASVQVAENRQDMNDSFYWSNIYMFLYFQSFENAPIEDLVASLNRINPPDDPKWKYSLQVELVALIMTPVFNKLGKRLVEYMLADDKYAPTVRESLKMFQKQQQSGYGLTAGGKKILALVDSPKPKSPELKKNATKNPGGFPAGFRFREIPLRFPAGCEKLRKSLVEDIIPCPGAGDAFLYADQILFVYSADRTEKLIANPDNVEAVTDAVWDGEKLSFAIINNNEAGAKGLSRGEIISWNPKTGKRERWDFKSGVKLEFLEESEQWKSMKKIMGGNQTFSVGNTSPPMTTYSTLQLQPCNGKLFVFASFFKPEQFYSVTQPPDRRVWFGVINKDAKTLKIFHEEKVMPGRDMAFMSFFVKPVTFSGNKILYYGGKRIMLLDPASLKFEFKENSYPLDCLWNSRVRVSDKYVFLENQGLHLRMPGNGNLQFIRSTFDPTGAFPTNSIYDRNNFFTAGGKAYYCVSDGVYSIDEKGDFDRILESRRKYKPYFGDMLSSNLFGIVGIDYSQGKFYTITLP